MNYSEWAGRLCAVIVCAGLLWDVACTKTEASKPSTEAAPPVSVTSTELPDEKQPEMEAAADGFSEENPVLPENISPATPDSADAPAGLEAAAEEPGAEEDPAAASVVPVQESAAPAEAASPAVVKRVSVWLPEEYESYRTGDDEVDRQLLQLYRLQLKVKRGMLSSIREAFDEYTAYPLEERSLMLKVQIILGKATALNQQESSCDKEVAALMAALENTLSQKKMDTSLAKKAESSYKTQKSSLKQELLGMMHSGADGSGKSGDWLFDSLAELDREEAAIPAEYR